MMASKQALSDAEFAITANRDPASHFQDARGALAVFTRPVSAFDPSSTSGRETMQGSKWVPELRVGRSGGEMMIGGEFLQASTVL